MTDTPAVREGDNAWVMLRRRKVVQWGLVYGAAAWGFLQGLEYISGTYDWPRQLQQLTTLALLIGLPIVLVLAWYHGDRGQQRITTPEFAILTLLLLLGGGAFWNYQRASEAGRDAAPTARTALPDTSPGHSDARPSVAVLPFDNRSKLDDDVYFVDGIHDDILTQLSKVSALRVISRTSVEQFRDTKLPMKAIADQLGVTKILEGGVQRGGDRVRINVQLIDAATDTHLWAETYDRELDAANIFAIQSEVALAIAGALETALTPAERARALTVPTMNLEAWEAYQIGKRRMATRNAVDLADAERLFRKAIELDPGFALAYAELANTMCLLTTYGGAPLAATLADAEKAAAHALKLDPNLAEAWTASGMIAWTKLDHERAERLFRRSIELNANYATAYHWLSMIVFERGRRDDALKLAERAVMLDPFSAIINGNLGGVRSGVGRFDEALAAYRRQIEIEPTMAEAYRQIASLQAYGFGRVDEAVPWQEKAARVEWGNATNFASVAELNWHLGNDAEAGRWLSQALAIGGGDAGTSFMAAVLYLDRGDIESSRRHAQRAAELDPGRQLLLRDHDLRTGNYSVARKRYAKAFHHLFVSNLRNFTFRDALAAIDLALVLQHTGELGQAKALLERSEAYMRTIPRMGIAGVGYADVQIHALRGETAKALSALREAGNAGCPYFWRYYRDHDPALASIRSEPEFKAVFADIERDMAQQRAALAARPKDAPLELSAIIAH